MDKCDTAIENLPALWKSVWTLLKTTCVVRLDTYNSLSIYGERRKPAGTKTKLFWRMSTGAASKKGWDWWGDTDVYVTEITGVKSFEEACAVAIIHDDLSMSTTDITSGDAVFNSWKQLWDIALRDLENDLPDWPGAPVRAVWIREFNGNDSALLAQKDDGNYYYVSFGTS